MLVAQQKRKENIAEYILYIYQIEDLIRAFNFDLDRIESGLVSQYQVDEKTAQQIKDWYKNLVVMMEKENIREKGHLQFLINLIHDVNDFHLKLLEVGTDKAYVSAFQTVSGLISELKLKSNVVQNDFQVSLDAVYGYLLLKMKKREISDGTTDAVKRISSWLGLLAKLFRDFESGVFEFDYRIDLN